MKKSGLLLLAIIGSIGWMVSCKKNTYKVTERILVTDKALLKLGYFSPTVNNPSVQAKVNGVRISNLLIYGTPFPGGGLGTLGLSNSDYLQLTPGSAPFTLTIPKFGTEEDSVKLFEGSFDFQQKRQTLFITDTIPNVTAVLVDDETAAPTDSGKVRIKFINLIPNAGPVDFYRGNELIKADIPYKGVTEYVDVFAGAQTYAVKQADSTTTLGSRSINPAAGRIYTFFSRGYKGAASAAITPTVSAMIVQ